MSPVVQAAAAIPAAPLLLPARDAVPAATAAALADLAPEQIVVLGGPASVHDEVLTELAALSTSGQVTRHSGDDRFATSAIVSARAYPDGADTVYLSTGRAFPDALAAGPIAGIGSAPLLLTERDTLPTGIAEELARLRPTRLVVVGGTSAVSEATLSAAASAAGLQP